MHLLCANRGFFSHELYEVLSMVRINTKNVETQRRDRVEKAKSHVGRVYYCGPPCLFSLRHRSMHTPLFHIRFFKQIHHSDAKDRLVTFLMFKAEHRHFFGLCENSTSASDR